MNLGIFLLVYRNLRNCELIWLPGPNRPFNLLCHCLYTRLTHLSIVVIVVVVVSALVFGRCNLSFKCWNGGLLQGNRLCVHVHNCLARGWISILTKIIARQQSLRYMFTVQMHSCGVVWSEGGKLTGRLRLHLIERDFLVSIHSLPLSAKFGEWGSFGHKLKRLADQTHRSLLSASPFIGLFLPTNRLRH